MKAEEKRVQNICLQWSSGASKKKNKRTTALQNRIDTLYHRYSNYLITEFELLHGLSLVVAKKI
jgi:light-regulated signal transduction histidine kinase (bacteriophytochrome)